MVDGSDTGEPDTPQRLRLDPSTLGTIYCILSAVFYTLMGICQRAVSEDCDPVWVNCVQASVSTVVFGVYLTFRSIRGRSAWPPLAVAVGLMMLGIVTQLGGSSYQWSLGVIGLVISNPLQMGVMLTAAALLGWLVLGERVYRRGMTAILLITLSVVILGTGAEKANEAMHSAESGEELHNGDNVEPGSGKGVGSHLCEAPEEPSRQMTPDPFSTLLGVGAACFAGVAFAILTVGMRKTATEDTSPEAIVFFINAMGIVFLGPWAVQRLGLDGMMATSPRDLVVMLAIGICNLMAFLLLAKALQKTTVVRVNVINNALTTVLTVLAGIVIFSEPSNRELVIGILLTLAGIVLISGGACQADGPELGETGRTNDKATNDR